MLLNTIEPYSEIIGNTAGLIVLISLLMRSLIRLRWINFLGSLIFCVYGIVVEAPAIVFTNLGIAIIDLWYLRKLYLEKRIIKLIPAEIHSAYYKHFMETNESDIRESFGGFQIHSNDEIYYMLSNNHIAGILVGRQTNDTFDIILDYVTPEYRDFSLGRYFFEENISLFKEHGVRILTTRSHSQSHRKYLKKLNFVEREKNLFYKKIP